VVTTRYKRWVSELTLVCGYIVSHVGALVRYPAIGCRYLAPGPRLPFQPQNITGQLVGTNGRAPAYMADDCRWIRHRRVGLRSSSGMMKLDVPPTRRTFGDRSFAVNGPRVWNSLVYRRQFATHHCHQLFFVTGSRLICSSNSCSVCDSERTPDKYSN